MPKVAAALSPTSFFRYVACPLRFYFHSVARLEADDEISEEVDAPMFGTILHAAVQTLYARIVGEEHPGETLRTMIRSGEVAAAVERAINENYLQDERASAEDYTGNLLLVKDIVTRYLRGGVMPYDAAHDAFAVSGLEERVAYSFPFRAGRSASCEMKFGGIADRIDTLGRRCAAGRGLQDRGAASGVRRAWRAFSPATGKQRLSNILQTLLYSMMPARIRGAATPMPALYYVRSDEPPRLLRRSWTTSSWASGGRAIRFTANVSRSCCARSWPKCTTPRCRSASARTPIRASSAISG